MLGLSEILSGDVVARMRGAGIVLEPGEDDRIRSLAEYLKELPGLNDAERKGILVAARALSRELNRQLGLFAQDVRTIERFEPAEVANFIIGALAVGRTQTKTAEVHGFKAGDRVKVLSQRGAVKASGVVIAFAPNADDDSSNQLLVVRTDKTYVVDNINLGNTITLAYWQVERLVESEVTTAAA